MITDADICPGRLYKQAEAARLLGVDRHTLARKERDPRCHLEPFHVKGFKGKYYRGRDLLGLIKTM